MFDERGTRYCPASLRPRCSYHSISALKILDNFTKNHGTIMEKPYQPLVIIKI
jgi:hypothetical protein